MARTLGRLFTKKIIQEIPECQHPLTLIIDSLPETKISEYANSVDLDEVAHNEPPNLDLHCNVRSLVFEFSV